MLKIERSLIIAAVALLGLTFVLPLWRIEIWAPQYPEGLFMSIGLSSVTGNLDQINILNHYIGMKPITPSAIPELRIMPKVVMGLMAFGLLAAFVNRRWLTGIWSAAFGALALVGLYDFYIWGYDYGHDLDPHAPIKVPGMSYQPPVLGWKTLLNIDAGSFPDWGGIALGLALGLSLLAVFWKQIPWKAIRNRMKGIRVGGFAAVAVLALGMLGASGCTARPRPIEVGSDSCETCRMIISDGRFGGEVITKKGRIHMFDSLPCLAKFQSRSGEDVKAIYVSDFLKPGELIPLSGAHFMKSSKINGPMGHGIIAAGDLGGLKEVQRQSEGEMLRWDALVSSLQ